MCFLEYFHKSFLNYYLKCFLGYFRKYFLKLNLFGYFSKYTLQLYFNEYLLELNFPKYFLSFTFLSTYSHGTHRVRSGQLLLGTLMDSVLSTGKGTTQTTHDLCPAKQ